MPNLVQGYLVECAKADESLRRKYDNVTFVAGCEYPLFLKGFFKGSTVQERLRKLFNPLGIILSIVGLRDKIYTNLNSFLTEATAEIRKYFNGKLTPGAL